VQDDFAMTNITFNGAVAYAEEMGKRLPDEGEYEFAATKAGRYRYPWGNDAGKIEHWPMQAVGQPTFDHTDTDPPVFGLFSNAAEWTSSGPDLYPNSPQSEIENFNGPTLRGVYGGTRIVRGGPRDVISGVANLTIPKERLPEWEPRYRRSYSRNKAFPGVGFRCARSAKPRFLGP